MTGKYERRPPKKICETYAALFQGMKQNSLEVLVEIAEEVFGLPLVLHDDNSRLLYQYPPRKLGEKMWDIFLTERTPGAELLWEYQKKMLSDKPVDFSPFHYSPEDPEESSYILGQIYDGEKNYGYFTIFMFDHPLEEEDLLRAKIFSDALCVVMSHMNAARATSVNTSLHDLLVEDQGGAVWMQAMENLERAVPGPYSVMVKPVGNTAGQKTYAAMALRQMRADIPVTLYGDCLVMLCGTKSGTWELGENREIIAELEAFLRPAGEGFGISQVFDTLEDVAGYYQQGCVAALSGQEGVVFYEKVAQEAIFRFAVSAGLSRVFISPVLDEIRRYDRLNKTEYFETLRWYSLLLHNKERAAAELCIHRNTLLYRLNRMEELFGVDVEEPRTALHLLNSYQLWDAMKL